MSTPAKEPDAETSGSEDLKSLIWRTRRGGYFFVFTVTYLVLSGLFFLAVRDPGWLALLIPVGPFFALFGWNALWNFMGAKVYRLTEDRLDIGSDDSIRSISLKNVVVLLSDARGSAQAEKEILIATRDERVVIPSRITLNSFEVFRALMRRVSYAKWSVHDVHAPAEDDDESLTRNQPAASAWARYPDLPRELKELHAEIDARGFGEGTLVFAGPETLANRIRNRKFLIYFTWWCVLSLAYMALMFLQGNINVLPGVVGALAFGFFMLLCVFISNRRRKRNEWLMIHARGIAMMGPTLTGEIAWDQVSSIAPPDKRKWFSQEAATSSPSGFRCVLETRDGARIPIPDHYDAPMAVIYNCARNHFNPSPFVSMEKERVTPDNTDGEALG